MVKLGSIYRVYRKIFGNSYIGQTIHLKTRIRDHLSGKGNALLARDIERYGADQFDYEILYEDVPTELLDDLEIQSIKDWNTFEDSDHYNLTPGGGGGGGNGNNRGSTPLLKRITPEDLIDIEKRYKLGESVVSLGKRYRAASPTIKKILISLGCFLDGHNSEAKQNLNRSKEEIKERYESGESIRSLKSFFKCGSPSIVEILKEMGCDLRGLYSAGTIEMRRDRDRVKERYESGESALSIARDYNCHNNSVRKVLREMGCKMRSGQDQARLDAENKHPAWEHAERIRAEYESGLDIKDLEKMYNAQGQTLKKIILSVGGRIRTKQEQWALSKIKYHPIWDRPDEIHEKYKSGRSIRSLAEEYKTTAVTLKAVLVSVNCEFRPKRAHPIWKEAKEVAEKYKNGMNTSQLAEEYNCSTSLIMKVLKSQNCEIRGKSERLQGINRHPVWDRADEVIERYRNGESTQELARAYDCCDELIKKILKPAGFELSKRKYSPAWKFADQIRKEYKFRKPGHRYIDLAEKYNCGVSTITDIIKSEEKQEE